MSEARVLIAGAGPTGLVLAIWLTHFGIRVRIVDKTAEAGTTSRALIVHARTLEFYRQIGLADAIVGAGVTFAAINLWVGGKHAARIELGDLGAGISPFPFILILPQDRHEQLLIEHLAGLGIEVERRTELLGFDDRGDHIEARLLRPDGTTEICLTDYIAGCDGAHSKVRETLGTGFPGGTYANLFYVADIESSGPIFNGELHAVLSAREFLAAFPMQGEGRARLVGMVPPDAENRPVTLAWNDVSLRLRQNLALVVEKMHWFSIYRVHHRVAAHFAKDRAFLAGDAAHLHSPVGGQGMNTGIGDAINLAWKLAWVLHGRADPRLLETYEPERIAFARRLVETTDRAFVVATSASPAARFMRLHIVPHVVPVLARLQAVRRFAFRTLSQTSLNYRGSPLNRGTAGEVAGGDRLPWVPPAGTAPDNFATLRTLDWQVHVYGTPDPALATACANHGLALHTLAWSPAAARAGLQENAAYVVRPDGYVALAGAEPGSLTALFTEWGLRQ